MAVRVQYTYRHSYCDLDGYSDRGGLGSELQYVYSTHTATVTACDLDGYSDKRGYGSEWQYVYNTHTITVTATYTDTLTEGGRGVSGSTCTVHVPLRLL